MTAPNDSFPDLALATAGILTVGQEVRGADLAERIKEPQLRPFASAAGAVLDWSR